MIVAILRCLASIYRLLGWLYPGPARLAADSGPPAMVVYEADDAPSVNVAPVGGWQ